MPGELQTLVEMQTFDSREAWLANRAHAIGGSEISAVVGLNPYMSNVDLWETKTGRKQPEDISENPFVKYGTQAERYLRGLFRLDFPQYTVDYVENNSFTNSKYPWAQASLDGWIADENGRRGVLEIKTSSNPRKWAGTMIPQNYYCQILFYMAVTESDFAILRAQIRKKDGHTEIRDYAIGRETAQHDIEYLMQKGAEFWEYVRRDEFPPLVLPRI